MIPFFNKNKISQITENIVRDPINNDKWSLFSSRFFEIEEGENDVFDMQDEF